MCLHVRTCTTLFCLPLSRRVCTTMYLLLVMLALCSTHTDFNICFLRALLRVTSTLTSDNPSQTFSLRGSSDKKHSKLTHHTHRSGAHRMSTTIIFHIPHEECTGRQLATEQCRHKMVAMNEREGQNRTNSSKYARRIVTHAHTACCKC